MSLSKAKSAMKEQDGQDAVRELEEWCAVLGLIVRVSDYYVTVLWESPDTDCQSVVLEEIRYKLKSGKPVSAQSVCRRIISNYFRSDHGPCLSWTTRTKSSDHGMYLVTSRECVYLKLPNASSPAELAVMLAAQGWPYANGA